MSTRLGVIDKERILEDLGKLYGRMYKLMPCPIEQENLPSLFNNLIPKNFRTIAAHLIENKYDVDAWFSSNVSLYADLHGNRYKVQLANFSNTPRTYHDDPAKTFASKLSRSFMNPPGCLNNTHVNPPAYSYEQLAEAFGAEFKVFEDWVVNFGTLHSEVAEAWVCMNEIVKMITTAGQLRRMIPDLIQYLPKERAEALGKQVRASSLPYDWSAYDRSKVQRMLDATSKCYLISSHNSFVNFENIPPIHAQRVVKA